MHSHGDRRAIADDSRRRQATARPTTKKARPTTDAGAGADPATVLALQRTAGNAAVTRLLEDGRPRDGATGQETVQRAVHGGTPGEVVQHAEEEATGGHGGIKDRVGGKIKEKPTNDVERGFYADMRAGKHPALEGVVPDSYTAEQVQTMDGEKGKGDDSTHIYIDNLTHDMKMPKVLDIKVGESTASKQELLTSMSKADAWKKKMKLKVADKVTGSADRGYRAVGGTGLKGKSRRAIGRESEQIVQGISADPSVYDLLVEQLTQVRTAAENSGLAFIAASVLIAVDEQPATESPAATAKLNLIDFAHTFGPEQLSEEQVKKYRTRFDKGMARLIADVKAAGAAKKEAGEEADA
ncbi:inositol polyphosphate kinase family protein [Streptomyces sp. RPA4-5]|uniref:inositol polyphosphate kinase family protein n=1 Tax=Streptomyces sp. RPA4-5 TaxID=2721245 RepID=UPI00143EA1CB|nr:inositol polyphosphate kinase family protein [Streptomyces sp. RPA4-5]QIY53771.1 inositol polyphosphate kinase family protein [Streptomyces sp. RPA4-5]